MITYLLLSIIAICFAYVCYVRNNTYALFITFSIICVLIGLQDEIGQDIPSYKLIFNGIHTGLISASALFEQREYGITIEPGWWIINKILPWFWCVTLFSSASLTIVFYRLLKNIEFNYHWLGVLYFLFVLILFFMSGIRQGVAISMFTMAFLDLIDKKYYRALIFFIISCTFHNSAVFSLVFIPLLLIDRIQEEYINRISIILFLIFVVIFIFSNKIQSTLFDYSATQLDTLELYSGHIQDSYSTNFTMSNILSRCFFYFYSLYAFIKTYEKARIYIFCFIIYQIFDIVFASSGELGRIAYYVSLFAIPAISLIPNCFENRFSKDIFIFGTVVISFWKFYSSISTSELFRNYIDYHTILF